MLIYPAMGRSVRRATFAYLDKNCVDARQRRLRRRFHERRRQFRLDERLLKLGMIWQWKAHKGSPYAEDMGTYADALGDAMGHDKPGADHRRRQASSSVNARVSYPADADCHERSYQPSAVAGACAGTRSNLQTMTIPAPTRGIIQNENEPSCSRAARSSATTGSRP